MLEDQTTERKNARKERSTVDIYCFVCKSSGMSKIIWYYLIIMVATSDAFGRFPSDSANKCTPPLACINLNNCGQFKNLSMMTMTQKAATLKFLKTRLCGFDKNQPKICCSELAKDDNTNKNSIPSIPSTIIIKVSSKDKINSSHECKPPFECIELSKCSLLVNLARMENPISPVVAKFIKSQSCGSTTADEADDRGNPLGNPRVCCSLKSPGSLFSSRTLDDSDDLHGTISTTPTTTTTITMPSLTTTAVEEVTTRTASKKHSTLVPLREKSKAMNFVMENWFDYTYFDFFRRRRRIYNGNK